VDFILNCKKNIPKTVYPACPIYPVGPVDRTGVASEDGTGVICGLVGIFIGLPPKQRQPEDLQIQSETPVFQIVFSNLCPLMIFLFSQLDNI